MKSFNEHLEQRKLALLLQASNIDVNEFCETIISLSKEGKLENADLFEIWQPISKLARGAAGLFGGAASMAGDAGRGIGSALSSAGSAAGNAGSGALSSVGNKLASGANAVKQGVQAAGNAVRQGVDAAGNYVGNKMQNSANNQAIAQTVDRINGVYDSLKALGYNQNQVRNATIGKLEQLLSKIQANQARGLNHQDELKRQNTNYQANQAAANSAQAGVGGNI